MHFSLYYQENFSLNSTAIREAQKQQCIKEEHEDGMKLETGYQSINRIIYICKQANLNGVMRYILALVQVMQEVYNNFRYRIYLSYYTKLLSDSLYMAQCEFSHGMAHKY